MKNLIHQQEASGSKRSIRTTSLSLCPQAENFGPGGYPTVTLANAREAREVAKKRLAAGFDPSETKKQAKRVAKLSTENALEPVAREYVKKQGNPWSEQHGQNYLRRLEVDIFPDLGERPIAEIDAPELLDTLRKIEARGAFDLAHRLLQRCSPDLSIRHRDRSMLA